MKLRYILLLAIIVNLYALPLVGQNIPQKLAGKTVFKGEYPLTSTFRGTQQTAATYAEWVKFLTKGGNHIPDLIDPNFFDYTVNTNWANQMAQNYPDRLFLQVMQARSGIPRSFQPWPSTVDRICGLPILFPGHWAVKPATVLTSNITATQTSITVQSNTGFVIGNYMPIFPNGCPALMVETDVAGKKLWNHYEYVYVTAISGNTLTITRANRDSPAASAFLSGRTTVAPIIVERGWSEPPVWDINMAVSCPVDANGKTAAQVLLDDLSSRFGTNGSLSNFSGVDFASGPFTTPPTDADLNWDGAVDADSVYYDGVKSFLSSITQRFTGNFVLLNGNNNSKYLNYFNGLNNEGLVQPDDPWRKISNALNDQTFWAKFTTLPYLNEEVLRIQDDRPENISKWIQLNRFGTGYATCLGSCANVRDKIFDKGTSDTNVVKLTWVELYKGTENVERWLGKPVSQPINVASKAPSILGNSTTDWTSILPRLSAQNGSLKIVGNELVFAPTPNKPTHTITMTLNLTQRKNLTVLFDVIANGSNPVNVIEGPTLSVPYQTGADAQALFSNKDFITREYYWRGLDSTATSCTVSFNFKANDTLRFRSMSAHEVPDAMARSFENGVVLVNPGLEDMIFNLNTLFGTGKTYKRLKAPTLTVPSEWQEQYQQTLNLNSGAAISDLTKVVVPGLNALFLISEKTSTGLNEQPENGIKLSQNYPNPTGYNTIIEYEIPNTANVSFEIIDALGRGVYVSKEGNKPAGRYSIILSNSQLQQGILFYSLIVDGKRLTKRMMVIK